MIRMAEPNDDFLRIAELIYQADPPVFSFLFKNETMALKKIAKLVSLENNSFSHKQILCYDDQGIKGILVGTDTHKRSSEVKDFLKVFSVFELIGLFFRSLFLSPLKSTRGIRGWYLQNLSVAPDFRGRGIGSALLDSFCDSLKRRGEKALWLDVSVQNLRAKKLYASKGFSILSEKKIPRLNSGVCRMKKWL